MTSNDFRELEKKPLRLWTAEEKAAYRADMARQQRIQETRRKVEQDLAEEKRQQELKELWDWYSTIDIQESFQAQKKAAESKRTAAVRRQIELEAAIADTEAPSPCEG